jgi:O-antigen ligase
MHRLLYRLPRPHRFLDRPIQRRDVRQAWAALLVLLFPLLSLVTGFGIGLAGFLFLFTACLWWRRCLAALRAHWPQTRWVLLAFLLHLACVLALAPGRTHGANAADGPLRMCIAGAAMLVVQAGRPSLRALWLGVAGGALLGAAFVGWQRLALGMERPGGLLNPITFGDLALCLALLALVGAAAVRHAALRWIAALGVVSGLAASLLTGSRGGWLALPVAFVLLAAARRHALLPRRLVLGAPVLACALALAAYAVPQTGVHARVAVGVEDVQRYLAGSPVATSIGVRLDLWKAGLRLAAEHPWRGLDTPAYKRRMHEWVAAGELSAAVFAPPEPPHMHNDALQALVTRGMPGLLAWAGILLLPFLFFRAQLARAPAPGPAPEAASEAGPRAALTRRQSAALAGMLVVLAYAAFGLSEVIFWSMKGSLFYALMVFLLMGWCLVDEEAGASADGRLTSGAADNATDDATGNATAGTATDATGDATAGMATDAAAPAMEGTAGNAAAETTAGTADKAAADTAPGMRQAGQARPGPASAGS